MTAHQSSRLITGTWLTPPEILHSLGEFDLDPCAAPEPRPWPTAKTMVSRPLDGLSVPWHGRVWLNPPYSREAVKWLRRLADHGRGTALVFARTETSWFIDTVWTRATALLFLHGRVHFHRADGTRSVDNAGAPSVLAAYGEQDAVALQQSGLRGSFCELRSREVSSDGE